MFGASSGALRMSAARAKRPNAQSAAKKGPKAPRSSQRAAPEKNSTLLKNAGDKPARYKPPRAGIGRVKGVPNAITKTTREIIQAVIDGNAPKVKGWLDRVAAKNPAKAVSLFAKLAEYVLPKLQRSEVSAHITNGGVKELPAWEDVSPVEAMRIYQEMVQAGKDSFQIKHMPSVNPYVAPPKPEAIAAPPPRPRQEFIPAAEPPRRPENLLVLEPVHDGDHQPVQDAKCAFCRQLWVKQREAAEDARLRHQRPPQVLT
jgi:hypothetical protein